jgi:eukaryotic-like serine/threonine-protein kinase
VTVVPGDEIFDDDSPSSSSADELLRQVARVSDGDLRMPRVDLAGQTIGRFRLLRLLGAGGMGSVYAAEDEALGRVVALKLLHRERTHDPDRRRRFLREARSASAVKHPNIALVFDVGFAGDELFIAMELCEGVSLRRHLAAGPLSAAEVVRIGSEIASGLAVAHARGIVHRDLKPDNVMIGPDGAVKILDFSLAKLLAPSDPSMPASARPPVTDDVTVEGRILGTPSYMSPEQARGLAVDTRSDIFALGIVLYEMATGVRPFKGRTAMETLMAVGTETVPPAHRRDERVPLALSRVIARCLEKDPDARWPGAREVATALSGTTQKKKSRLPSALAVAVVLGAFALVIFVSMRVGTRDPVVSAPRVDPSAPAATSTSPPSPPASTPILASVRTAIPAPPDPVASIIAPARPALPPHLSASASTAPSASASAAAKPRPSRDPLGEQK